MLINMVADPIDENQIWKEDVVRSLFNEEKAKFILNIPISHTNGPNKIIWKKDKRGVYSIKKGYQVLSESRLTSPLDTSIDWQHF